MSTTKKISDGTSVWVAPVWGDAAKVPKVFRADWQVDRRWVVTLSADGDVIDRAAFGDKSPVGAILSALEAWGLTPVTGVYGWAELGSARCDGNGWTLVARDVNDSLTTPLAVSSLVA